MTADLLIHGGAVLTVDGDDTYLPDGAVAITGDTITAVGPSAELLAADEGAERIDAAGCLVMPGLINTHTHMAMVLLRGSADDLDLQGFLERVIEAESRRNTPASVATGTELAIAESLRAGTTTALDMYWFHDAAAAAGHTTGFRLLGGPTFMDVPTPPDRRAYSSRMEWAHASISVLKPGPGGRSYLFPHSAYTLDAKQLTEIFALGRDHGALIHIHAAENAGEVELVRQQHGMRPVEFLDSLGLLGPDVVLAHAVHLSDEEIDAIARTGTSIAHCPASNLKLASGFARVPDLLEAGVTVGLGSDGAVSSNTLDMFTAIRLAALIHKGSGDPTAVNARQAVRMATIEGARVLGAADALGSLEAGKLADVITVDLRRPHLTPAHDPWAMLAYAATGADVRDTIVGGKVLMRDRQLTTIDEEALLARASED